jgi:hypothetical protein
MYLKSIKMRKKEHWDNDNNRCFKTIANLNGMNASHIFLI